jgi:hypothetical protein
MQSTHLRPHVEGDGDMGAEDQWGMPPFGHTFIASGRGRWLLRLAGGSCAAHRRWNGGGGGRRGSDLFVQPAELALYPQNNSQQIP